MKAIKTVFTAAVLMAVVCLPAQNKNAGINLSFWKDICAQPYNSTQTTYVSLGLSSALNCFNGAGINVLGSVIHGDMSGVQITGSASLVGGTMRDVQIAGVSNISGSNTVGPSTAGLVNITGDGSKGVIASGLTGIGGDNNPGVMISDLTNMTGNMASRFQFFGVSNIMGRSFNGTMTSGPLDVVGENMNGLQITGIANITVKDLNGAQTGLCSYAMKAHGFQIGLVSYYREDMKGLQLSLVNVNPDIRIQTMVYGGNVTPVNIGMRFKNQLFYTILGVGAFDQNLNNKLFISASYRVGLAVPVYKGPSISDNLGLQHMETRSNKDKVIPRHLYGLQVWASLEYQTSKKFGIFIISGYGLARYYNKSGNFDKGAIIEAGIVLF